MPYEVKLYNGDWPFRCQCATISDVFECLVTLDNNFELELDKVRLMQKLVELEEHPGFVGFADETTEQHMANLRDNCPPQVWHVQIL